MSAEHLFIVGMVALLSGAFLHYVGDSLVGWIGILAGVYLLVCSVNIPVSQ